MTGRNPLVLMVGSGPEAERIDAVLRTLKTGMSHVSTYEQAERLFVDTPAETPIVCFRVAAEASLRSLVEEVTKLKIEVDSPYGGRERVSLGDSVSYPQIRFVLVPGDPRVRLNQVRELLNVNIADVLPVGAPPESLLVAFFRAVCCLPKSPERLWGSGVVHNVTNIQMALPGALDLDEPGASECLRALIEIKLLAEQIDGLLLPQAAHEEGRP